MIAAVRFGVGIVICWEQSGVENQALGLRRTALITPEYENRTIPIIVRILLHCTCKIDRIV